VAEENGQVTASWTFMMALLLIAPPMTAVAIAGAVSLIGDVAFRKPFIRVLFNLGEIVLSLSLAAAVLDLSGRARPCAWTRPRRSYGSLPSWSPAPLSLSSATPSPAR